jgi:hypothetical protein
MAAPEGNTFSSRNNRLLTDTLRRIAIQGEGARVRKVCEEVFAKAEAGDLAAAAFIFDRLEGKPVARTEHTGADGEAIELSLNVRFR